jgi:membrane associated rhomboid family serine protease
MSITLFFIMVTVLVSYVSFGNRVLFERLKFNAYEIREQQRYFKFFTYGLLHADWMHLLINMFVLYSFGSFVEDLLGFYYGNKGYLYFSFLYVSAIGCSVIPLYFKHRHNHYYNAVGASGAVSSVLFAYIIMYPEGSVSFMFIPIPIPAALFGILYLAYSTYMARKGTDNIAHDVHAWGALYGIIFVAILDWRFVERFFKYLF